jgi:hypothetical protein
MFNALHCRLMLLAKDRNGLKEASYSSTCLHLLTCLQITQGLPMRQLIAHDMSGLEAVPFIMSPCTASLKKEEHNQEMTHGFSSLYPTDQLQDYNFANSNIRLGTQGKNLACWNYQKDTWTDIFRQLDNLRVDESAFWPSGEISWQRTKDFDLASESQLTNVESDTEEFEEDWLEMGSGFLRVPQPSSLKDWVDAEEFGEDVIEMDSGSLGVPQSSFLKGGVGMSRVIRNPQAGSLKDWVEVCSEFLRDHQPPFDHDHLESLPLPSNTELENLPNDKVEFTISRLEHELVIQKWILGQLDRSVQDRDAAEVEVCAEITKWTDQIQELRKRRVA